MTEPTDKLRQLIDALDRLGPAPSLVDLTNTLKAAGLTPADLAGYVKPSLHGYNRAGGAGERDQRLFIGRPAPARAPSRQGQPGRQRGYTKRPGPR